MHDTEGIIRENLRLCRDFYRCKIELARPIDEVIPGQFIMLKVPSAEIFFRRPFSIYDYGKRTVTILYKTVGKGTRALASAPRKERVMVLGPLGHGFEVHRGYTPVLVAGGIGIAGIHLLWKQLEKKACLFYGCSTEKEVPLLGEVIHQEPRICTLDGSAGFCGNVIQLLESSLSLVGEKPYVYACGPQPMFANLKGVLAEKRIPCQVLVEERMACGLGLCFGCVKKTLDDREPYKRACVEGPVFDLWQISL
ncbi:MAG TPA: dihydroorotate dehydrogenase electron transfer subunit [Syntrophorhabdales bacterium]|nr:dihydroorotate dehydrogenase electron transfer subunit [Syntrophorhabdales bacterium]